MADWDADSPRLRRNLSKVLGSVRDDAMKRIVPDVKLAKSWQAGTLSGLVVPDPAHVGRFRGEAGLEGCEVRVGNAPGVAAADVLAELAAFEIKLRAVVAELDVQYPAIENLDEDGLAAAIDVAAWAHSEWVRIHP